MHILALNVKKLEMRYPWCFHNVSVYKLYLINATLNILLLKNKYYLSTSMVKSQIYNQIQTFNGRVFRVMFNRQTTRFEV